MLLVLLVVFQGLHPLLARSLQSADDKRIKKLTDKSNDMYVKWRSDRKEYENELKKYQEAKQKLCENVNKLDERERVLNAKQAELARVDAAMEQYDTTRMLSMHNLENSMRKSASAEAADSLRPAKSNTLNKASDVKLLEFSPQSSVARSSIEASMRSIEQSQRDRRNRQRNAADRASEESLKWTCDNT